MVYDFLLQILSLLKTTPIIFLICYFPSKIKHLHLKFIN